MFKLFLLCSGFVSSLQGMSLENNYQELSPRKKRRHERLPSLDDDQGLVLELGPSKKDNKVEQKENKSPKAPIIVSPSQEDSKALFTAIKERNLEAVVALLENKKVSAKIVNKSGFSALHMAVVNKPFSVFHADYERKKEIVSELLRMGADINAVTPEKKFTPLHFAYHFGDEQMIHMLMLRGASVIQRDKDGCFPKEHGWSKKKNPYS